MAEPVPRMIRRALPRRVSSFRENRVLHWLFSRSSQRISRKARFALTYFPFESVRFKKSAFCADFSLDWVSAFQEIVDLHWLFPRMSQCISRKCGFTLTFFLNESVHFAISGFLHWLFPRKTPEAIKKEAAGLFVSSGGVCDSRSFSETFRQPLFLPLTTIR